MSWYTLTANVPWLTLVVLLPLVGALLVALTPSVATRVIKQLGILTAVITLALVFAIIGGFQRGVGGLHLQFEEALRWIPSLGISYHLGIDGLSLFLLGLNALLFLIAIAVTDSLTPRLKEFILLLLILEAATAGILLALDLSTSSSSMSSGKRCWFRSTSSSESGAKAVGSTRPSNS